MLNPKDRDAIEGLFWRLQEVENKGAPRDREAETLIARNVAQQTGAPYYMAQTILVQETALKMAEQRIGELEERAGRQVEPSDPGRSRGPWDRDDGRADRGGGFLAGAAQTALGVTAGVLIGSAVAGILSGAATAGEWGQSDQAADQQAGDASDAADQGTDVADDGGDGSFDGGDGGFDMGGDF